MSSINEVWVAAEAEENDFKKNSLELMSIGRELANSLKCKLCVLLLGDHVEHLVEIPKCYGCDKVFWAEHSLLMRHNIDTRKTVIVELIEELSPQIVLFGATSMGRELAPRVAARLKSGLVTECHELKAKKDGTVTMRKPVYGGKAFATFSCSKGVPQMATIVPGVVEVKERVSKECEIVRLTPSLGEEPSVQFIDFIKADPKKIDISEAELIVSVGRGVSNAENIHAVEKLADVLGASIGGSRVAVDLGWIAYERQIGLTGKTVAPKLMVACGISGQYPHTVGMEGSGTIIAINNDRNAPIFKLADLGILADLKVVMPAIEKSVHEYIDQRGEN